jgi:periplasmic divalent cation tolerance protein
MKEDSISAYLVVLVTVGSSEEAHKVADELLNQRRAACVNVVPGVSSLFWWQGRLDSAHENLLIIKTKASQLKEIVTLVSQIHSYDVPEIIALPIIGGSQDYLDWVGREVE